MKISSRIKQVLSISLVSVLAATVMPSQVLAYEEYEYDDSVVTVEVELSDGGGDTGCEGISTLELPDSTLRASFDQMEPGISEPDIIDYLAWWREDIGEFTQDDLEDYLDYLDLYITLNGGGTVTLDPLGANVETLTSISYTITIGGFLDEDTDQDGVIEAADAPDEVLTETRRTYVTDEFPIGFDANDCVASEDIGLLLAGRGYVMRWDENAGPEGDWVSADVNRDDGGTSSVNRGDALLISPVSLFNNSLPRHSARDVVVFRDNEVGSGEDLFDWSPIAFGEAGEPEMRAALRIYGADPTGKYQTKFYFLLEVGDEEYFDGLWWFLDDYFDEGWLP